MDVNFAILISMTTDKHIVVRVRGVIVDSEGKLLVVHHTGNTSFAALPGGHLEWGETVHDALSREMVEELGVVPVIGRLLYVNNFTEKDSIQSIEFFFEILNGDDYKNLDGLERTHAHELDDVVWISKTDDMKIMPQKFNQDFKEGNLFSGEIAFVF